MQGVRFNKEEANIIINALFEKGVVVPDESLENYIFDSRLLSNIDSITINKSRLGSLRFLKELPNLKSLYITSDYKYENVLYYGDYFGNFNEIDDYSDINSLEGLEDLSISNCIDIRSLQLSNLSNLKRLSLIDNPSLRRILGVNKLHNLRDVEMHGNHIDYFEGFDEYLYNTIDASENIVDLSVLFTYVKSLSDMKELYNLYLTGLTNVEFSEKNGQVGYYKLSIPSVAELYKKINAYFKRMSFNNSNFSKWENINNIYKYVVRNIRYSDKEIASRSKMYYDEVVEKYDGTIPEFFYDYFGYMHSSYNTYHFKRGNCEGMVNLMKFMASMLGIDTEDVHCNDRKSFSTGLNHAILRVKCNGVYTYFDPAYGVDNKRKSNNYSGMSFDETCKYLELPKYEMDISYKSYCDKLKKLNYDAASEFYNWVIDNGNGEYFNSYLEKNLGIEKEEEKYVKTI